MSLWYKAWYEAYNMPTPEFEFRFDPYRKWRFDHAYPAVKVAVEVQGGVWSKGRHVRGKGYLSDREKINRAQAMGWIVLELTPQQFRTGEAAVIITQALQAREKERHEKGSLDPETRRKGEAVKSPAEDIQAPSGEGEDGGRTAPAVGDSGERPRQR